MRLIFEAKSTKIRSFLAFTLAIVCALGVWAVPASAKSKSKKAEISKTVELNTGYRDVVMSNGYQGSEDDYNYDYFNIGDHGLLTFSNDYLQFPECPPATTETQAVDEFNGINITYTVEGEGVVEIDEKTHNYTLTGGGKATVTLEAKKVDEEDPDEPEVFTGTYVFLVTEDMTGVTLEKNEVALYTVPAYGITDASTTVALLDCPDMTYSTLSYTVSNKKVSAEIYINERKRVLDISASGKGTATVNLIINGTAFELKLTVGKLSINKDTCYVDKGKTVKLKISGYSGKPDWQTTVKSVATVNSSGKVKGKKIGTTIIYADIEGVRIGCAVSVVKKGMTKVVNKAIKIGKTCKYSQPKRMQKKYYDCSSLVWKSYKQIGKYFGLRYWAPTAADEAKWCSKKKKLLGKWSWKKLKKFTYRPGDLLFRVGAKNGRYKGIYHVEMFAGYRVVGFDKKGKALINMCWANRYDNYYDDCYGDIMGRP
ncbi:MAG: hypothetical protein K5639_00385 [Eubacterium sp.]|nr:hypothetical protein [Eubacterium sp.]